MVRMPRLFHPNPTQRIFTTKEIPPDEGMREALENSFETNPPL